MNTVRVKVSGLRELGAKLQKLDEEMKTRIAKSATAAGARVIRDSARMKAPKDTGKLAANIVMKHLPKRETDGTAATIVTVRRGKKGTGGSHYAAQVEYGFTRRYQAVQTADGDWITLKNRPLENPVMQPPQPFMRPAFDENKSQAVQAVKETIARLVDQVARKP